MAKAVKKNPELEKLKIAGKKTHTAAKECFKAQDKIERELKKLHKATKEAAKGKTVNGFAAADKQLKRVNGAEKEYQQKKKIFQQTGIR